MFRTCFVTVGTTEFDQLIQKLCTSEVANLLSELGVQKLVVQFGRGLTDPNRYVDIFHNQGIDLDAFRYKSSIAQDIREADLILGHAGAGTCLECLEAEKVLVIVTNDQLQDAHQTELAERFALEGFLIHTVPGTLPECLQRLKEENGGGGRIIKRYRPGEPKKFVDWFKSQVLVD